MKKYGGKFHIAPDFLVPCMCLVAIITASPSLSLPLPSNPPVDDKLTAVDGKPAESECHSRTSRSKNEVGAEKGRKKLISAKDRISLPEDTLNATINAPVEHVWTVLSDFSKYPQIFDRVKSVSITKREGDLVYIESRLKPHLLVGNEVQHTVNDLSGKPGSLKWQLLDGNFKHVDGVWEIKPTSDHSCKVAYTLKVDPGPFVPAKMVSFLLHFVEKEVVASLKIYAEKTYTASINKPLEVSLKP
jgi:ribosome-associated toxin RatA of RatAB toxin-antitoxin module